jgi:hypothetical protein
LLVRRVQSFAGRGKWVPLSALQFEKAGFKLTDFAGHVCYRRICKLQLSEWDVVVHLSSLMLDLLWLLRSWELLRTFFLLGYAENPSDGI